jgi:conjugative transfer signal peptidase TraF
MMRGVNDPHAPIVRPRPAWTMRPGGRAPRARSSLVFGVLVLVAVVSTRWVRVNVSPSAPLGLYRLAAVAPPLARGTLVVLPVPPVVQRWHSAWLPLLKPIAALPGDLVCTSEAGLWIEGQAYGPVYPEAGGAPLPRLRGCVRVPAGAVFLASPAPRSLDGRYFGLTPVADLTAWAIPLLTWRKDPLTARDHARAERHADVPLRAPSP